MAHRRQFGFALALLALLLGCGVRRQHSAGPLDYGAPIAARDNRLAQVAFVRQVEEPALVDPGSAIESLPHAGATIEPEGRLLLALEGQAQSANPRLQALREEVAAAMAKSGYADALPDPSIGANVFAHPIETAAGSQRANLTIMQELPWFGRLDARAQQAFFEALALEQRYEAQRLKVVGDVRTAWYRLYVIQKQIEIHQANQQQIKLMLDVASVQIDLGKGTAGDIDLGTLEYTRQEENLLALRQQLASTKAELNRLVGRDANVPIDPPQTLDVRLPNWSHEMLRQIAEDNQPEIAAAHIRAQATRWGVEVARLERRPDLSLSASWFAMDDNRPPSTVVDVGRDAWSLGAQVSLPLWHAKYDAKQREANSKHFASHASVEEMHQRYDALLRDLWQQATASNEAARLYKTTILPQAEKTHRTDRRSYAAGAVEFDRVVRDLRNLLNLQLSYYRAIGQLATSLARIQQAIGQDLAENE